LAPFRILYRDRHLDEIDPDDEIRQLRRAGFRHWLVKRLLGLDGLLRLDWLLLLGRRLRRVGRGSGFAGSGLVACAG
jgi:hypothetical protein